VVFDVRRLRGPRALPIAGSVLVHAALAGWLSWVALRTVEREKQEASAIAAQASVAAVADDTFEAPTVADGLIVQESSADPVGDVPRVTAGDAIARLDANGAGHGGDAATRERALNLADRDERARLSPDSLSRLDRDQRIRIVDGGEQAKRSLVVGACLDPHGALADRRQEIVDLQHGSCRIGAAKRHLPDFGIAAECGFGRRPSHQDVLRLIKLHADIIDDARTKNSFGLLMSLNMLIETPGGFDYTGADCSGWMKEAGFATTRVEHLVGPDSMVVGIK